MIPRKPTLDDLDLPPILDEDKKAINQTVSGKAQAWTASPQSS